METPDGHKRPNDVVGNAYRVFQIAVGESSEKTSNRKTLPRKTILERSATN